MARRKQSSSVQTLAKIKLDGMTRGRTQEKQRHTQFTTVRRLPTTTTATKLKPKSSCSILGVKQNQQKPAPSYPTCLSRLGSHSPSLHLFFFLTRHRSTPAAAWGLPKTEEEEHHTAHEQNVKVYTLTRVTSGRSTRKRKCHLEAMAVVTSALGGLLAVVAGCWLVA